MSALILVLAMTGCGGNSPSDSTPVPGVYSLSRDSIILPASPGPAASLSATVTITRISGNTGWKLVSSAPWLTLSAAAGSGSGSVTFTAEVNADAARYAIITLNDAPVCTVCQYDSSAEFTNQAGFAAAITGAQSSGGTIVLTQNVSYSSGIAVNGAAITLNLNGCSLNVETADDRALYVYNGGSLDLAGAGGEFNVTGNIYGVYTNGPGSRAEVTSAIATGDGSTGVYAGNSGTVEVSGGVKGGATGANAYAGGVITVKGDATGNVYGAFASNGGIVKVGRDAEGGIYGAYANEGSSVEAGRDAKGGEIGAYAYNRGSIIVGRDAAGSQYGVYAERGGSTSVGRNAEGNLCGAYAYYYHDDGEITPSSIDVGGDAKGKTGAEALNRGSVTVGGNAAGSEFGVYVISSGEITVEGSITVADGGVYIFANSNRAKGSWDAQIGGYYVYTGSGSPPSTVRVKIE